MTDKYTEHDIRTALYYALEGWWWVSQKRKKWLADRVVYLLEMFDKDARELAERMKK